MSVIFIYLPSIQQETNDKEYHGNYNPYPESLYGEFIRKHISQNWKAYHQLDNIITKLGKVVYLLLVHHGDLMIATDVPWNSGQCKPLINSMLLRLYAEDA